MLCALVGQNIHSWETHLCQAEFAHNHASNRSSSFSPFQIVCSMLPQSPLKLKAVPDLCHVHGRASDFIESLRETHSKTRTNLEIAIARYKSCADAKRRDLIFEQGEMVWIVLTKD